MNIADKFPLIDRMRQGEEVCWHNRNLDNALSDEVTEGDVDEAAERLERFAPYIRKVFPETGDGIIESPLSEISAMRGQLAQEAGIPGLGRMFLKRDSDLPISGSIKARGGIYEVLCFAENVARENGILPADYSNLTDEHYRELFSKYTIAVGSTGNLGLSIGIMGAKLGFGVTVHMSTEAKQWKKDLLRSKGVNVVEHSGDYELAVAAGRAQTENDPYSHFVDDEKSKTLFLGYAVAARRLKAQLDGLGIVVDDTHPLFVYLPCGVGGAPGGVAYGLKQIYGRHVRCYFAEPVEAPAMLLGVMTGQNEKICAQDIGLSGRTVADGLAVSRPSELVARLCGNLLDGLFSVSDDRMLRYVAQLYAEEGLFVEPSATAGFPGYALVRQSHSVEMMANATHIAWATGGSMVPPNERNALTENL